MKSKNKINGLNTLRGIAAIIVVVGHVPLIKKKVGVDLLEIEQFDQFTLGDLAVTFFFVLSGFLITLLLIKEYTRSRTIAIGKFYQRRVLRIWPLYYLLLLTGIVVVPTSDSFSAHVIGAEFPYNWSDFLLHLTFFPNLADRSNPICFQSWSIGIEEQFYLVFPIVMIYVLKSNTNLYVTLGLPLIAIIIIRMLNLETLELIEDYLRKGRFDAMIYGAIAAKVYLDKFLIFLSKKVFRFAIWFATIAIFIADLEIGFGIGNIVYGTLFSISLVLVAQEELNTEPKLMNYVGRISYGVYMYHVLVIYTVFSLMPGFVRAMDLLSQAILYLTILFLTILTSSLSYRYFENPFLKLKKY